MARRVWPDDVKRHALALVAEVGQREATRRLAAEGTPVPHGTIASWVNRAGIAPVERMIPQHEAAASASRAVRKRTAEERKRRLLELLGELAEVAAEREFTLLARDDATLRDVVGVRTRAIHDLLLLAGEATSRAEVRTVDSIDAQVEQLVARLEHAETAAA
jgi:hypothetical protein